MITIPRTSILAFALMLMATATPVCAQEPNASSPNQAIKLVERSDDDLVLVALRIGRTTLADGIAGYATKTGVMLPLKQITEALQISIKVVPQEGQAEGWIINEENSFTLDVSRQEAVLKGKRSHFTAEQVEPHADDIYVDSALLSEWLQVDFTFSFASQTVDIAPRDGVKLPIQIRTEREQAHSKLARGDTRGTEGPFPRTEIPYKFYTLPYTDVTYTGGYDKRSYSGAHNGITALSDGDLFYMHSSIYAAGDTKDKLTDLRWTLSRRDPDGKIFQSDDKLASTKLGEAMHDAEIREVAFGDISPPQLPLTAIGQQGRGALISNIPYDRATQYDRTTIQGDLQTGWEVELYRNDELLSFQRASANGRYEFTDVPLLSGLNIIRLVFYGPFGQSREETQRFLVSANLTQQGKSYFRASVSQQNTNSFDVRNQNQITNLSGTTPAQNAAVQGKARAMFEYEYGLLDNLSLFANTAHFTTTDNVTRNYVGSGVGTTLAGVYGRADVAHDVSYGGNALKFLIQDNLAGISISAEHQQYMDFVSEFTESATDSVLRRSTVRADTPLTLPYLPQFNNGVSATQTLYDSDRKTNELNYRLATAIHRVALSHNLTYRTDSVPTTTTSFGIGGLPVTTTSLDKQTTGEFIMSFPVSQFVLRGNVMYGITPEKELQTLLAAAEYNFSRDTNTVLQIDKQLISQKLTNITLGLNHNFEKFRLGSNVSHSSDGNNALGVTLSLSFGEDPRTGDFRLYPDYSAGSGIISARTFHDVNGNGTFDEGDRPLENARLLINHGTSQTPTDSNGEVLLRNIQPDTRSSLTLDSKSIENPYLMSKQVGVDVVTRAGVAAMVEFPITGSGDVEGTVRIASLDADTKDAANVDLQLFTTDGKLVRETQTSFDGYYLLNGVPAGEYILRVSPEQAGRLGFITPPDRGVTITNDEADSHIIDLEIIRDPMQTAQSEPAKLPPRS